MPSRFSYTFRVLVWTVLSCFFSIAAAAQENSYLKPNIQQRDSLMQTYLDFDKTRTDEVISNLNKALEINRNIKNDTVNAFCYYALAYCYRNIGDMKMAIQYQQMCLEAYTGIELTKGMISSLNELGILYNNIGEYQKSIEHYLKGIKLAEQTNNKHLGGMLHNVALVYRILGKNNTAIKYLLESLELKPDTATHYNNYLNIGVAYKAMGNDSLARSYYNKAMQICETYNLGQSERNNVLHAMYPILLENGGFNEALQCLMEIKTYEEENGFKRSLATTYLSISKAYHSFAKYDESVLYAQKAIDMAKETEANPVLLESYLQKYSLYWELENYKESTHTLWEYNKLRDSLFTLDKQKHAEELMAQFDVERKEQELKLLRKDQEIKEIALRNKQNELGKQRLENALVAQKNMLLNKENELQALNLKKKQIEANELKIVVKETEVQKLKYEKEQAILKQKNTIKNFAIAGAGILIVVAFGMVVLYQQKLKTAELLRIKTEEISKQEIYQIIREQEILALNANLEGQEKERKRIAQELHDGIGGNLASIKLSLANLVTEASDNSLKSIVNSVDKTYKEVREISHNLLPSNLYKSTFIRLINSYIDNFLSKTNIAVNFAAFPEDELNNLSGDIKVELYRIIQELMNNIVKHAQATSVEVQLSFRDQLVNLMVEDNGIGFDINKLHMGIGLRNIKSRVQGLSGEINIDSSPSKWTLVNIEIPVSESDRAYQKSASC